MKYYTKTYAKLITNVVQELVKPLTTHMEKSKNNQNFQELKVIDVTFFI